MEQTKQTKTFIKRMLACIMAVVMMLTIAPLGGFVGLELGLSTSAASEGDYNYTVKADGTVEITGYNGAGGDIVIPSKLGVRTVTSIHGGNPYGAFYECNTLRSVTIPGSVTYVGSNAFKSCKNLTKVTMNYGVEEIGDNAFRYCNNLVSVTIPNSVTSIGNDAFEGCAFKNVTIPDSVTSLGECAFGDCKKLTNITIPGSVVNFVVYNYGTFQNCTALTSVTIQSGVTSICRRMFIGCNNLKSVIIPSSVMTIGNEAFSGCESLTDVYYTGTQKQWNEIEIGSNNAPLLGIRYHYNYVPHDHSYTSKVTKAATCTANGIKTFTCKICGETYNETIKATGHKTTTTTTKATTSKDGKTVTTCTVCKATTKTVTIAKVSSIKLSATSYTYDGKAKTPTVTVKDSNGKALKNGTDYTVTHESGRKNIGTYTVKVTLKGNYSGSKTLKFKIVPAKVASLKAKTQTTKSITLSWKKVAGAAGYEVYKYDSAKKAYVKVKTTKETTYKVKDLKAGTTYKFKVRAYKKVDGSNVYGAYSSVLSTATKTATPKITVTAGSKKATVSWKKITGATGYMVYMATSKDGTYKRVSTIKKAGTVKFTKKDLTKGKTYYFKVRTYKKVDGKNIYSNYSSIAKVKVK